MGGTPHALHIVHALVMRNFYRHPGTKGIVNHKADAAQNHQNLIRRQTHGTQPSNHHARKGKNAGFHTQLNGNGQRFFHQQGEFILLDACCGKALAVRAVALRKGNHPHIHQAHQCSSGKCGIAGTLQPHFRGTEVAIDKDIVAHNVERIANAENPHSQRSIAQCIGELTHHMGEHHRHHRHQNQHIIVANERHQFGGLPQQVKGGIESRHGCQ